MDHGYWSEVGIFLAEDLVILPAGLPKRADRRCGISLSVRAVPRYRLVLKGLEFRARFDLPRDSLARLELSTGIGLDELEPHGPWTYSAPAQDELHSLKKVFLQPELRSECGHPLEIRLDAGVHLESTGSSKAVAGYVREYLGLPWILDGASLLLRIGVEECSR